MSLASWPDSAPDLIDVAAGRKPADLVVRNGQWVNVHSGEIIAGTDLAVVEGRFAYCGPDASHCIGENTTVVDAGGRYLGMFRKNLVISSVLPQVAIHTDRFSQVVRMIDAGLLRDNLRDIRDRYALIAQDPVASHLDKDAPVLRPDQSLVTALYYLYRGRNFLPVVDPANSRLLGVVSTWDVLETMRGGD